MLQTNRRRLSVDVHLVFQVTPVDGTDEALVLIKAIPYNPVVLSSGYTILDQIVPVNKPGTFKSVQQYVLDTIAKIAHEIANDMEEAGYTSIEDLMLKLSEHK
jgi:hypothetical protein